jgi:hypothetical protein
MGTTTSKSADVLAEEWDKEGAGCLLFGDSLNVYFWGLIGMVGPPDVKVLKAVHREHCSSRDSKVKFTGIVACGTPIVTTSETEWKFVTEPDAPIQWPVEERLKQDPNAATLMRKPMAAESLHSNMQQLNAKLEAMGADKLAWQDVVGARLFTGPMHVKYNAVLRGLVSPMPFLKNLFQKLCLGNQYTTTLHVINTCIVKLGKLTYVQPVYRGMSQRVPPKSFFVPNEQGVMGGVEFGFLSASVDRTDAEKASQGGHGLILELEQDAISRGADLTWLSQYPHESTIVFSPLCFLQLLTMRVEAHPMSGSDILVCTTRVITCQATPTIDQMITKRKVVLMELCHGQVQYVRAAVGDAAAAQLTEDLAKDPLFQNATDFNDDDTFCTAISAALEHAKKARNVLGA